MKVIGYMRVSTDDKNQDPERQRPVLEATAKRDGHEIVHWCIDEGTKAGVTGMPTFDRPKVKEALRKARELGAKGFMVENVDRWTRKGADDLGYSIFVLRRDYGIELLFADLPTDSFAREILPPLMASLARMDNKRRSDQARTSAASKKAKGIRVGRKPKADLTDDEYDAVVAIMQRKGGGLRKSAVAVSAMRGAHEVFDPKAKRDRTVSASWVGDRLAARPETLGLLGRVVRPCHPPPSRKEPIPEQEEEALVDA